MSRSSKLDEILENLMLDVGKDGLFAWSANRTAKKLVAQHANRKEEIKDLLQQLIDETFNKDDAKAYEFWKKIEAL